MYPTQAFFEKKLVYIYLFSKLVNFKLKFGFDF